MHVCGLLIASVALGSQDDMANKRPHDAAGLHYTSDSAVASIASAVSGDTRCARTMGKQRVAWASQKTINGPLMETLRVPGSDNQFIMFNPFRDATVLVTRMPLDPPNLRRNACAYAIEP